MSSGVMAMVSLRMASKMVSSLWLKRLISSNPIKPAVPLMVCKTRKIPLTMEMSSGFSSICNRSFSMESKAS